MDNGDGARFMVLGRRMAHKFTVLYFLPHVIKSAIIIITPNAHFRSQGGRGGTANDHSIMIMHGGEGAGATMIT